MKLQQGADLTRRNRIYRWLFMPILMVYFVVTALSPDAQIGTPTRIAVTAAAFLLLLATDDILHWTYRAEADGLSRYGILGAVRLRRSAWSEFAFVGVIRLAAKGKRVEKTWLVCAKSAPIVVDGGAYTFAGTCVLIDDLPENRRILAPYYKGGDFCEEMPEPEKG